MATFPASIWSFTPKVDGVDNVMAAHVNEPSSEIVVLEQYMLEMLQGWIISPTSWTSLSGSSFRVPGKDYTAYLYTGAKIRCVINAAWYYGYVVSATYVGGNTDVTIIGDTLPAGTISQAEFSSASNPCAFPHWFSYTPTVSQGASSNISKTVTFAIFSISGRLATVSFNLALTGAGSAGSPVAVSLPVAIATANYNSLGTGVFSDASVAQYTSLVVAGGGAGATSVWFVPTNQANSSGKIVGQDPSFAVANGDSCAGHISYRI